MPMEEKTPKRKPRKRKGSPNESLGTGGATSPAPPNDTSDGAAQAKEPLHAQAAARPLVLGREGELPKSRDLDLLALAIRERWPIREGVREIVVHEMETVLRSQATTALKVSAAKVLVAADAVNVKREGNVVADQASKRGTASTVINIIRQQVTVTPGEQLQPGLVVDADPPQATQPAPPGQTIDATPSPPNTSADTDGTS